MARPQSEGDRRYVMSQDEPRDKTSANRRDFLQCAAGLAAGATLAPSARADEPAAQPAAEKPLPTIALGGHQVSRLIIGGNPVYGYSHFNRLLS
jgi:hypothetical protein